VTRTILRKKKFVPKKSLEVVVTNLKDRFSSDYQSQPMSPVKEEKSKEHDTKGKYSHYNCEVDFKNKRVGRVISRLIRNKKKHKDDTIPTITIIDQDSSEDDHTHMISSLIYHLFFEIVRVSLAYKLI
jgi:hypothetical protein